MSSDKVSPMYCKPKDAPLGISSGLFYVIIRIERCPIAAVCCLLTSCRAQEGVNSCKGRAEQEILMHDDTAGPACKQGAGEQHSQGGHVMSLSVMSLSYFMVS